MGFSILNPYYKSAHPNTDKEFKEFCLSQNIGCIHEYISKYFPGKSISQSYQNHSISLPYQNHTLG